MDLQKRGKRQINYFVAQSIQKFVTDLFIGSSPDWESRPVKWAEMMSGCLKVYPSQSDPFGLLSNLFLLAFTSQIPRAGSPTQ